MIRVSVVNGVDLLEWQYVDRKRIFVVEISVKLIDVINLTIVNNNLFRGVYGSSNVVIYDPFPV